MNNDELRACFHALRTAREDMAGKFRVPRRPNRERRRRSNLVFAVAALVPVAIVGTVYATQLSASARERRALRDVAELITWRSPTDALLHNAYADWQVQVPSFTTLTPIQGDNP